MIVSLVINLWLGLVTLDFGVEASFLVVTWLSDQ